MAAKCQAVSEEDDDEEDKLYEENRNICSSLVKVSTSLILQSHILSCAPTSSFLSSRIKKIKSVSFEKTAATVHTAIDQRNITSPASNVSTIPPFLTNRQIMPPRIFHSPVTSNLLKKSAMYTQTSSEANSNLPVKTLVKDSVVSTPNKIILSSGLSAFSPPKMLRQENVYASQQLQKQIASKSVTTLRSYPSCPICQSSYIPGQNKANTVHTPLTNTRLTSSNQSLFQHNKISTKVQTSSTAALTKHHQKLRKDKPKTLTHDKKILLDSYISKQPLSTSATTPLNPLSNRTAIMTENIQYDNTSSPVKLKNYSTTLANISPSLSTISNVTETTGTQTNQTLLLSMPDTIDVDQYSNQTLNLDTGSIAVLKALLEYVKPLPTSTTKTSLSSSITAIDTGNIENTIATPVIDLPVTSSALINTETPLLFQSSCGVTNNAEMQISNNLAKSKEQSELPIAVVKIDFVDNKPQYSIQLMGKTVPVAAITVPTADGMLELHSGDLYANAQVQSGELIDEQCLTAPATSSSDGNITIRNLTNVLPLTISSPINMLSPPNTKAKYTCEICGKSYARSWSFYSHQREHEEGYKEYSCVTCNKKFPSVPSLKQHLVVHKDNKNHHQCSICDKTFPNSSLLRMHQLTHAEQKAYTCKAADCGKQFNSSSALKIHQRVHQEEKPYRCTHLGCEKAFKTPSELSRHEFRHTGEKPFKCDQCDKSFVRNDDLKRHSFIHTGQKRFKCELCDFTCIQSFDLVKHKYVHGGEKPYKCNMCPRQFTRPARLREHERLHTGERPFVCEICGKSFTQLTSLKSHKLTHGGPKPYQCDQCKKSFINATDLQSHLNTHLGVKPFHCSICNKEFVSMKTLKRHAVVHSGEKPFECNVCQKLFARLSDLKVHAPVHSKDKPYKCDECSKTFTRVSTLKEHKRIHTGEFPFKCDVCGKEFNHRSHLNVHIKSHTGEKPFKCTFCTKEFSRKTSLKHHLHTHGVSESMRTLIEDDQQSNYSDTSEQQMLQLEPNNIMKPMAHIGFKRKHDKCVMSSDHSEITHGKRAMTETHYNNTYSQQLLSNTQSVERSFQEIAIINNTDLSGIICDQDQQVIQLPSDQLQLPQYLHHDTVHISCSLGLENFHLQSNQSNQTGGNLLQINNLANMNCLEANPLIEHQQNINNQTMQNISLHGNQPVSIPGSLQLEHFQIPPPSPQQHSGQPQHQVVGMTQNMSIPSIRNSNTDNI